MAFLSIDEYIGDGVTTDFTVTFGYLAQADVTVLLDDVEQTLNTDYSFLTDTTIRFTVPPPNTSSVVFNRDTNKLTKEVDFQNDSALLESQLDTQFDQLLYIVQEADDAAQGSMSLNSGGQWNGDNRRIADVANPVNTQDAVTLNYLEANYTDVSTVAGIAADVSTVAGIDTEVSTVSSIAGNVTTVAGVAANVSTVAGISGNVSTVAGIDSDVSTVAGISSDVSEVAGFLPDTLALYAETARDAVGTALQNGNHSFISFTPDDANNEIDAAVDVLDEDNMTSNSAAHLATQQSIKTYVDSEVDKSKFLGWVRFNGTSGSVAINSEYFVTGNAWGVTRNSTGNYTVTIPDSLISTGDACCLASTNTTALTSRIDTATTIVLGTFNTNGTAVDASQIHIALYGELA